jgi:hypothetical protein
MNKLALVTIMILLLSKQNIFSQISGSNQASFQVGNQPDVLPSDQSNLYDQLNLRYTQDQFVLGLRSEIYEINTPAEYSSISQKFIRYRSDDLQLQLGNFHEILGRGLLLRSFEIPGSIYEVYGQRYGFYKDIEGLSIRYQNDFLNTKFLYGRPLDRSLPPSFGRKARRSALTYGGEINYTGLENVTPGIIYLRSNYANDGSGQTQNDEYWGINMEGLVSDNIQFYTEYTANSHYNINLDFNNKPQAFYSSASIALDGISITGEYKYYNDFVLVFNDPPPVVREHSFTLLNRAIHVMNLENESGYQLEILLNLNDLNTITLNHARGMNDIAGNKKIYQSYYVDLNYYFSDQTLLKTFVDYSMDESEFQYNRYTLGFLLENPVTDLWSLSSELQVQQYTYNLPTSPIFGNLDQDIKNAVISIFASRSSKFSLGSVIEISNDNRETDPQLKRNKEVFISWPSFNMSYQYNQHNTFSVFYGKRRGGNACTGGVCYQVLPFEGLELRLNSRF